jgi:hypothetical protein
MTVTVSPETFRFVHYEAAEITRVAERLVASIGLDRDVHIEIDETTPLARVQVEIGESVILRAESGAFEDTRRPRQYSATATEIALGRVLLRTYDRLSGQFADAPSDTGLSLGQASAWTAYCMGRLVRLGVAVPNQRYLYDFRNRHGFSDAADAAFDKLWHATDLTWAELDAVTSNLTISETR